MVAPSNTVEPPTPPGVNLLNNLSISVQKLNSRTVHSVCFEIYPNQHIWENRVGMYS